MKFIKVTDNVSNGMIYVQCDHISKFYHNETEGCTMLIVDNYSIERVAESPEEIIDLIDGRLV